jgi:hypothetical protein
VTSAASLFASQLKNSLVPTILGDEGEGGIAVPLQQFPMRRYSGSEAMNVDLRERQNRGPMPTRTRGVSFWGPGDYVSLVTLYHLVRDNSTFNLLFPRLWFWIS